MIKFFRKIRQNMIKENRISKYMLYAIGEIILVVIGILFALQINNWNLKNNSDQLANVYLIDFKHDLETDIASLKNRITINKALSKTIDSIFSESSKSAVWILQSPFCQDKSLSLTDLNPLNSKNTAC